MKVEGLPTYSELFAALDELVIRCGDSDGVRADGSNIQTYAASAILAKYHSAYQAAFESEQQAA